jgi:hypothetical protein
MKNETQMITMYIAFGAILAYFILYMMGRIRTERFEEQSIDTDETEKELMALLNELME